MEITIKLCDKSEEIYDFISNYLKMISFDSYMNSNNFYQIGAFIGDELIGARIFKIENGRMKLYYSSVKEEYRKCGVNNKMSDVLIEIAKNNNIFIITSNVRFSNIASLKSLYRMGLKVHNMDKRYKDGEVKVALVRTFQN